jgi:two-component system cell cycle response regulator
MAGRILVVDDVATNRLLMTQLLEKAYYDVEEARTGEEALAMAERHPPDLALVDVMMPGMSGYDLCRRFKAHPVLSGVPVVIVTTLDTADDRREGIEAGADDFLTKPVRHVALFARLRSLLRMKAMTDELRLRDETLRDLGDDGLSPRLIDPPAGARVIGVTSPRDGPELARMLTSRLDVTVQIATDAPTAFRLIAERAPEAVLIDSVGFKGFSSDFIAALRQRPETRSAALLTLVDAEDFKLAATCLDAGSNDYAMWPIDPSELSARLRTQMRYKAYADHLRASMRDGLRMAATDPLTGLRNRRYVDTHLARMIDNANANQTPMSLLAFDLDRFKSVNDTFGHAAGDSILKEFSRRLLDNIRSVDMAARLGGEEFIVVMPDAAIDDGRQAAERVRRAIEAPGFQHEGITIPVTVSVGVAGLRHGFDSPATLAARADAALYIAKAAGRNRVILEAA